MTWSASADVNEFDDAIEWFRKRVPMTDEEYAKLTTDARRKAFRVAGVADLDLVADVHKQLEFAITDGQTLADFKESVGDKLRSAWASKGDGVDVASRLETIFRTNTQLAYGAGRYKQLTDPAVAKYRPYVVFDSVDDHRRSSICTAIARALAGKALPLDDDFVKTHVCPLHVKCRSGWHGVRTAEAEKRGIAEKAPEVPAAEGFGQAPGAAEWKPDLTKYPEKLAEVYKEKQAAVVRKSFDPSVWTDTYKHLGEGANAAAHGRAAEEFGMHLAADDIVASLERGPGWMKDLGAHIKNLVDGVRNDPIESRVIDTLLDLEEDLKRTLDDYQIKQVRTAAAIGGHREAIELGHDPKLKVTWPRVGYRKEKAQKNFAEGMDFMKSMLSKNVDHGSPAVGFVQGRAYYLNRLNQIKVSPRSGAFEHEWGHALEEKNPKLAARAQAFLKGRTEGESLKRLRDLKPGSGYKPHEVTRPDKFRDPYVGRHYDFGAGVSATEVTSMGVEWISKEAALFWKEDPEHFYFTLGQLAGA